MSRSTNPHDTPETQQTRATHERRRYDSPLRRQQHGETRERIVAAASELVHSFPAWDWRGLTFRAVGERAGVSERTVHRHFASERLLRDAVVQRLVEESGVSLEKLELADFGKVTAGLFAYLSSFAVAPPGAIEPAFVAIDQHRRDALRNSVARATPDWPDADRAMATAMLDILWNVPTYERLVTSWQLDAGAATQAVTWVIGLVEEAIRAGRKPSDNQP